MLSILEDDVVAGFWGTETGAGGRLMMKYLVDEGRDGGIHAAQASYR